MRVTATFSDGLRQQLNGKAVGDEFTITATARIVGAEETLIDVRAIGDTADPRVLQGELEVHLLISHASVEREENPHVSS
jgi:hypothetical protein